MAPDGVLPFDPHELDGSVPDRFARVVAACPGTPAISWGAQRVTYEALDRRASALAAAVARAAPDAQRPVAVVLDDPVAMVTALLATWRAGRISVAVEPAFPPSRIAAILDDSGAALVITDAAAQPAVDAIPGAAPRGLRVEDVDWSAAGPPRAVAAPDSPLYIVYTSGSTGAPKGVVQTHRNRLHRTRAAALSFGARQGDRVSALNSTSFAAGMRDVFIALLTGGTLVPFDVRAASVGALADWLDREQVTVLCMVVSTFRHLVASLDPARRFRSVRVMRFGSEAAYREDVEAFRRHFPADAVLIGGYGSSETAGLGEYRIGPDTPLPERRVPAGYAMEGVEFLILGDDERPLGPGEVGEVVIRSRHLSPGYWRRGDLTSAAFRAAADGPGRLYHTGDVGRLAADGCLEVVGRKDHQVKVRGYRVHPGEIEAALAAHPDLREAVVVARPGPAGAVRLVAFVVPEAAPAPDGATLRRYLRGRLPAYMVPAAFVPLAALPALANGKVDRAALPDVAPQRPTDQPYVAPRTPVEAAVAEIWADVLQLPSVGIHDDFLELGGESLLAGRILVRVAERFGLALTIAAVAEVPTVAAMAALVVSHLAGSQDPAELARRLAGPA